MNNTRYFNKNSKWYYKYHETLLNIVDIFKDYTSGKEPHFDSVNDVHKILKDGKHLDVMTSNLINYYINELLSKIITV